MIEHDVTIKGERHPMYDLMGKDAVLFHHAADDPESTDAQYIAQAQLWFHSLWSTITTEWTR